MHYSISHIVELTNASLHGKNSEAWVDHVIYDSRKISSPKNALFVCIEGLHHDGHHFIQEAYNQGIRIFLIERKIDFTLFSDSLFILVDGAIKALQTLAAFHRESFLQPVIGITGSNGKTIVKEWINQLLSPNFLICRSPRSFNSQLGVPLSVLEIENYHNLAIIEAGISQPSEMKKLADIVKPTIGVFTMIGEAHQQNFTSLEEKIEEKIQLFAEAETLVCSDENNLVLSVIQRYYPSKNIVLWGKGDNCKLQIINESSAPSSTIIRVKWQEKEKTFEIPFTDSASIHNAVNALTVALVLYNNLEELTERISFLTPINMRLQLISGAQNTTLINDAYSSDLTSLDIALDFQQQHADEKKKTIILSDMVQTGVPAALLYKKINTLLQNHKIEKLIGIGPEISNCKEYFSLEKSFYSSTSEFIKQIKPNDHSGEIILIKGARSFEFEKIIQLLQDQTHETVLEIHLDALAHNFHFYKNKLNENVKLMVMVKASGYGAGALEVAKVLQYHKADYLGVAYVDEGVALRRAGISLPIMVMNVELNALEHLLQYSLEPELFSLKSLTAFIHHLKTKKRNAPYPVHIKIDTGMKRLGFEKNEIDQLISTLQASNEIVVKSVFTHLAASDNPAHDAFTQKQLSDFSEVGQRIQEAIGYSFIMHAANTSGIERFPEAQFNMVRLGIGLYGISNSAAEQTHLQNVGVLKTSISQLKNLLPGDSVGYNRNFIAEKNMTIATIPLGYADGLRRSLSNGKWAIKINNTLCPIVGNVCMDMTMVDVSAVNCKEGDEAIVFENSKRLQDFATACQTIPYEVLTSIPLRVKRIYSGEV